MPTFLRSATWHEVAALFPTEADAIRNADGWAARYGERFGMIDGKHRAHRWKRVRGQYAALVVLC